MRPTGAAGEQSPPDPAGSHLIPPDLAGSHLIPPDPARSHRTRLIPPGAGLLTGLFLYDAFFVFKSDVMLTVATQIEAPAKFLFAAVGSSMRGI